MNKNKVKIGKRTYRVIDVNTSDSIKPKKVIKKKKDIKDFISNNEKGKKLNKKSMFDKKNLIKDLLNYAIYIEDFYIGNDYDDTFDIKDYTIIRGYYKKMKIKNPFVGLGIWENSKVKYR